MQFNRNHYAEQSSALTLYECRHFQFWLLAQQMQTVDRLVCVHRIPLPCLKVPGEFFNWENFYRKSQWDHYTVNTCSHIHFHTVQSKVFCVRVYCGLNACLVCYLSCLVESNFLRAKTSNKHKTITDTWNFKTRLHWKLYALYNQIILIWKIYGIRW